jgi:hypothetical protein
VNALPSSSLDDAELVISHIQWMTARTP